MQKNKRRAVISLALAAIIPLSFGLAACSDPVYEETGNTVTFNYNDGKSRPYSVVAEDGETVNKPTTPIRKGYTFEDWYTDKDAGTAVTFPYTPTSDVTFYARWGAMAYNITFDHNIPDSDEKTVVPAQYETNIEAPASPTRDGYQFRYWQTQPDGGSKLKFPYTVMDNATFYARWLDANLKVFEISFDLGYEDAPDMEDIELEEGQPGLTAEQMTPPTRIGYEFKGWSTAQGATSYISYPYTPTDNVKLYANWKAQTYRITFDNNYIDAEDNVYHRGEYPGGGEVAAPEGTPTRAGYTFDGWYASDKGGAKIEFPVIAARNTTYYAHWVKTPITPKNNIFDAEFTVIDPTEKFPGYSGDATGIGIIQKDDTDSAFTADYPTNSIYSSHLNHYITYLYKPEAKLTFVINSDKDVSNVTLYASLAYEIYDGASLTIAPTGDFGFSFIINDKALNYSPVTISSKDVTGGAGQYKGAFKEYKIATNVSLKQGANTIVLAVNNKNPIFGGVLTAAAPMVDYIRLETNATLTWSPVYDNVYQA